MNDNDNSEAQALRDIIEWSQDRCLWQRDALRRLCQSAVLTDDDIEELVEICKATESNAEPISHEHIRDPDASAKKVDLKSIHDVENVNALAPNQKLSFGKKGLTIVYGDNGSGKSGYTRILKQMCRARDSHATDILSNIYGTQQTELKAQVQFVVGEQNQSTEWIKDKTTEPLLSSVSIFDSNTANIHVNKVNDVAYVPFPIMLLSNLADACKKIKSKLEGEINALNVATPESIRSPECPPDSAVDKIIANLKADTNLQTVEALAKFGVTEEERLKQLQKDLADDPEVIASGLNKKLRDINALCDRAEKLSSSIVTEQHTKLKELYSKYLSCKQASQVAATTLFERDPLPKIGSEEWAVLWEAARRYSEEIAYAGQAFPLTDDGSHCVLCQQALDTEAKERLNRFEKFVTDNTKQQEEQALNNYKQQHQLLLNTSPSMTEILSDVRLCEESLNNVELAKEVRAFFIRGKWRLRALLEMPDDLPNAPAWNKATFDTEKAQINRRVSDLTTDNDAVTTRTRLIAEKADLEGRRWLNAVKNDVIAEIERKKKIYKLETLIKSDTTTQKITTKSTRISKNLVTETLQSQFAQEIDKMKLEDLKVEMKQKGSSLAQPQFQILFKNSQSSEVGAILSEGEFRCVALAAFLAELATNQSKSAIVFDDPVSSLDHRHRETIAERLANEALTRQIIVFTHDINFVYLLGYYCREVSAMINYRHITKRPDPMATGICHMDVPPNAQDVSKKIQSLANRLNKEKIHHEEGNDTEWHRTVRSLRDEIRSTWEYAVEDFVGKVVRRFSNNVDTKHLAYLTVLTPEDCEVMREAYRRCSEWLHSSGASMNRRLPSPCDIQKEIKVLEEWHSTLSKKQESINTNTRATDSS